MITCSSFSKWDKIQSLIFSKRFSHSDSCDFVTDIKLNQQNLPENMMVNEKKIIPEKTNNSFIHLSINTSINYQITCQRGVSETIDIIYENTDNNFSSHSIQFEVEETSKLHLRRLFISPEKSCINTYTNIIIANNSKVVITEKNNDNLGHVLDFIDCKLGTKSNFFSLNQSYLSQNSRFQNRIFINGEESNATLHGLAINEKEQACFYNTHIYHDTENSESHQLFKSMVKSNSTLEYNGKVTVCKDAQQTNSYQLNQNILLDDFANVYSRPQLFIDADDVKCTHGSTTGDINEHEVFYLMSRGLDKLTSRKIVLNAFFEEVFNKIEFKSEQSDVHEILNQIL